MKSIIKVENVSKLYRLGQVGTGSLKQDISKWWHKVQGKEDPFLILGESNDRNTKGKTDFVWALEDINFSVMPGEVLGIIGRNGAGNSTLLRILSRVTEPTKGSITMTGRVASLLEVGTGFHPDLTGRENIFLNGAIMGMTKNEITRKFDEIVDFAGVERYIDTPVKRYSSGMHVRLGFAVAAHLEPEILIVDEVLAVGDAEFQKKCLGKMHDVSRNGGKTILIVSHNLNVISSLTQMAIVLNKGKINFVGNSNEAIHYYLKSGSDYANSYYRTDQPDYSHIKQIAIKTSHPNSTHIFNEPLEIMIDVFLVEQLKNGAISIQIVDSNNVPIVHSWLFNSEKQVFKKQGLNRLVCSFPKLRLYLGDYHLRVIIADNLGVTKIQMLDEVCQFKVEAFNKVRDYKWEAGTCTYLEEYNWHVEA